MTPTVVPTSPILELVTAALTAADGAVVVIAVVLLVAGVLASFVPAIPGAALSLAGILLYWWSTGYTDPGTVALTGFVLLALVTLGADWFAGALSARAGGASTWTMALAAIAGFILLFIAGPVGILLGIAGTVFLAELYRHGDARRSARAATFATVGVLASTIAQVVLTGLMLVAFLVVVIV